jgi:hypothetical protein
VGWLLSKKYVETIEKLASEHNHPGSNLTQHRLAKAVTELVAERQLLLAGVRESPSGHNVSDRPQHQSAKDCYVCLIRVPIEAVGELQAVADTGGMTLEHCLTLTLLLGQEYRTAKAAESEGLDECYRG